MTNRQEELLKLLLMEHQQTGATVSSLFLANSMQPHLSSATVRKELLILENEGYLTSLHTSSGRIPTSKAYRFFFPEYLTKAKLSKQQQESWQEFISNQKSLKNSQANYWKEIAKYTAQETGNSVALLFSSNDTYYTGLSNLLSKDEFVEKSNILSIAQMVDQLDLVLNTFNRQTDNLEIKISIGEESNNLISELLSAIYVKPESDGPELIVLFGVIRMNYFKNIAFLKKLKANLSNL